ncbi:MAG TPA: hypothetical protein VMA30_05600 [Xanthobacteraceae bacterium]|nr:hypothetical protein [Xanthobacteraceae bacterium]
MVQRVGGVYLGGRRLCRAFRPFILTALLAACLAGCSFNVQHPVAPQVDPNLYPQNYRKQVAVYLSQELSDRSDFRGARISSPVLKPVGGDAPHYVVCLQFNGRSQIKNKVVIYLAGDITQFIDSTPELCSDAVYTPFTELEQVVPGK